MPLIPTSSLLLALTWYLYFSYNQLFINSLLYTITIFFFFYLHYFIFPFSNKSALAWSLSSKPIIFAKAANPDDNYVRLNSRRWYVITNWFIFILLYYTYLNLLLLVDHHFYIFLLVVVDIQCKFINLKSRLDSGCHWESLKF